MNNSYSLLIFFYFIFTNIFKFRFLSHCMHRYSKIFARRIIFAAPLFLIAGIFWTIFDPWSELGYVFLVVGGLGVLVAIYVFFIEPRQKKKRSIKGDNIESTRLCLNCSKIIDLNSSECSFCGYSTSKILPTQNMVIEGKFCSNYGKGIPIEAKFCTECGSSIS